MQYCEFPGCDHSNHRSKMDYHHIVPKEFNGEDGEKNRIWLCPNHHRIIYIEGSTGNHSMRCDGSIEIVSWRYSTAGKILEYIENGETKYYKPTF